MQSASDALNSRFTDMFKAFQYVDLDRSGTLDKKELRRALDMWNIPIDDEKLDELIAACDHDGDGQVDYKEFVDVLARDTVAPAAMGKRGMQSQEAMGESAYKLLDEMIAGGPKKKAFDPSINASNAPIEVPGARKPPTPPASRGGGGGQAMRPAPRPPTPDAYAQRPPTPDAYAPPRPVMKNYASRAEMLEARKAEAMNANKGIVAGKDVATIQAERREAKERGLQSSAFKIAMEQINNRFTDMKKAFRFVDTDNSGTLDKKEIRRAMDMWNIPIDDEKLDDLIAACDTDGDGHVVYNEFIDVLARDTVAPAAMGKRGMQSQEAMGESAYKLLDEMIAGGPKKKAFDPSINAS